jgi:uncharacterized protein
LLTKDLQGPSSQRAPSLTSWRPPAAVERRPLLTTAAIVSAVVGVVLLGAGLLPEAGLSEDAGRSVTTWALALAVSGLLTWWRGWRAVGFTGPRAWRDLGVLWLPVLVNVWPAFFGLQTTLLAVGVALLWELPNSFAEETLMRGVVLRAFAGRRAWRAAVVSGVAFGLLHLVVLAWGQPMAAVLPLVVVTSLFGIGHACVRLRTGTVWAPLALHALFNVLQDAGAARTALGDGPATVLLLVCAIVYPLYGLWLLRGGRTVDR